MTENMKKEEQRRQLRRRRRIILGAVVAFLVIFGLVSLVQKLVQGTMNLFDDTEEKKEYEERVKALVMLDAIPFESLDKADDTVLLQACIWDVLFNEDITKFQTDENGAYLVPTVDIDRYAAKLFGPSFQFNHRTFTASADYMEFKYNEDSKTYTMPITSMTNNFTPSVVEIKKEKNTKRVTVGYMAPPDVMTSLGSKGKVSEEPVKYYDYIFTRTEDEYYLTAITESERKPEVKPDEVVTEPQLETDLYVPEAGEALTEDDQKPIDTSSAVNPENEPAEEESEADADSSSETESEAESSAEEESEADSDSDSEADSSSDSKKKK